MRTFGRLLQRIALVLPPLSIVLQLADKLPLGSMLVMLIAAVAMFYIGRLVEGFANRNQRRRRPIPGRGRICAFVLRDSQILIHPGLAPDHCEFTAPSARLTACRYNDGASG